MHATASCPGSQIFFAIQFRPDKWCAIILLLFLLLLLLLLFLNYLLLRLVPLPPGLKVLFDRNFLVRILEMRKIGRFPGSILVLACTFVLLSYSQEGFLYLLSSFPSISCKFWWFYRSYIIPNTVVVVVLNQQFFWLLLRLLSFLLEELLSHASHLFLLFVCHLPP